MNNASFAAVSVSPGLLVLARGPGVLPVRRRVPIVAWQTDSWTKNILVGKSRRCTAEKVRVLRLKKS